MVFKCRGTSIAEPIQQSTVIKVQPMTIGKKGLILNIYTTVLPMFRIYLMYVSPLTETMKTSAFL